jgi:RNA polymerase sigma-70 factor, ECF subfamily
VSVSDRDLIRDVRRGNREAYGELVQRCQGRLFGLVLMMVRQPAGAQDVAQDAFVRAYTHLDLYEDRHPFYPWLATIAVRLAQNWLRRHARTERREGAPLESSGEPGAMATALSGLIADERSRAIWTAVAALTSGERTALTLYYRDELPVRDIAGALGVTEGTIKTLLFRGRRRLRERLDTSILRDRESP